VRALSGHEIIQLWETAHGLHPVDQALSLLLPVMPAHDRDALAALPLGRRDALLLALRRATFGDRLPGKSDCPRCGQTVEFELRCSALAADGPQPQPRRIRRDGYRVTVRPLDSFDLAAAAGQPTMQQARDLLLRRCVSEARHQDEPIEPAALPREIAGRITETALAADPRAEVLLDLTCPACGHTWQRLLDIGHILWLEITARAKRLLMEVHLLARAYGWTEAEILELSPARRAAYLQMVSA
jgi:hypothetical protein